MAIRGVDATLRTATINIDAKVATFYFELSLPDAALVQVPIVVAPAVAIGLDEQRRAVETLRDCLASWGESLAPYLNI